MEPESEERRALGKMDSQFTDIMGRTGTSLLDIAKQASWTVQGILKLVNMWMMQYV